MNPDLGNPVYSDLAKPVMITNFKPGAGGHIVNLDYLFTSIAIGKKYGSYKAAYTGTGNPFDSTGGSFFSLEQVGVDVVFSVHLTGKNSNSQWVPYNQTLAVFKNTSVGSFSSANFSSTVLSRSFAPR